MQTYFNPNTKKSKFKISIPSFPKFGNKKASANNFSSTTDKKSFFNKIPWKWILRVFIALVVILILASVAVWFIYGRPAYAIYQSGLKLKANANDLQASLKTQDLDKINNSLKRKKKKSKLKKTKKKITLLSQFKSNYYQNYIKKKKKYQKLFFFILKKKKLKKNKK